MEKAKSWELQVANLAGIISLHIRADQISTLYKCEQKLGDQVLGKTFLLQV